MKTVKIVILLICAFSAKLNAQNFTLPKLEYSYNALEPYIDAQTMEIHYTKHHQAYINNLNKALTVAKIENQSLEDLLLSISRRSDVIRNNAGGHYNHSLFWEILTPKKDNKISKELENQILLDFVSLDSLKKLMNQAASTRFGSGWAWLIVTPEKKLMVCSTSNQDNPLMDINPERGIPILGIDVWEHAYYLKYQNKRGDYLSAIWNVINWDAISAKYTAAMQSSLLAFIEKDSWKALKELHKVIAETFHAAEEGNLDPIKKRSSELVLQAINLRSSAIPKAFNSSDMQASIDKLVKDANALHKMISKKAKDAVIKAKLFELHETYHKIQQLCSESH